MTSWSSALADEQVDAKIGESALREARSVLSQELLGHYDIVDLAVQQIEDLRGRLGPGHDYGLVRAVLTFSTKRNVTRYPGLNPEMFTAACRSGTCSRAGSSCSWR